jgi:hypothetical protein
MWGKIGGGEGGADFIDGEGAKRRNITWTHNHKYILFSPHDRSSDVVVAWMIVCEASLASPGTASSTSSNKGFESKRKF